MASRVNLNQYIQRESQASSPEKKGYAASNISSVSSSNFRSQCPSPQTKRKILGKDFQQGAENSENAESYIPSSTSLISAQSQDKKQDFIGIADQLKQTLSKKIVAQQEFVNSIMTSFNQLSIENSKLNAGISDLKKKYGELQNQFITQSKLNQANKIKIQALQKISEANFQQKYEAQSDKNKKLQGQAQLLNKQIDNLKKQLKILSQEKQSQLLAFQSNHKAQSDKKEQVLREDIKQLKKKLSAAVQELKKEDLSCILAKNQQIRRNQLCKTIENLNKKLATATIQKKQLVNQKIDLKSKITQLQTSVSVGLQKNQLVQQIHRLKKKVTQLQNQADLKSLQLQEMKYQYDRQNDSIRMNCINCNCMDSFTFKQELSQNASKNPLPKYAARGLFQQAQFFILIKPYLINTQQYKIIILDGRTSRSNHLLKVIEKNQKKQLEPMQYNNPSRRYITYRVNNTSSYGIPSLSLKSSCKTH